MKVYRLIAAVILSCIIGGHLVARAQEGENSLSQLREQLAKLEAVDRGGELPESIRSINRDLIARRSARLRVVLEQRINALVKYRSDVASMISPAESQVIERSIREMETELQALGGQTSSHTDAEAANYEAPVTTVKDNSSLTVKNADVIVQPALVVPTKPSQTSEEGDAESDVLTIAVNNDFRTTTVTIHDPTGLFHFNQPSPISNQNASTLINETLGNMQQHLEKPNPLVENDYCIIHVVQWKAVTDQDKPDVKHDLWLLYKLMKNSDANKGPTPLAWIKQKDFDGKRIYGSKRVAVLLVQLGVLLTAPPQVGQPATPSWDIAYKVAINKKTPAPFKHAIDLIGALSPTGGAAAAGGLLPAGNFWGGQLLDVADVPSDIVVSASIAIEGQQNKEFTRTYDNEGRYHWDVSLGLPVKTIRELQFNSDGNRVTTSAKERQDVYGFLNIYPKAVDVKADDFLTYPHFVFGVPLASKPLHHPFAGIGLGVYKMPIKFNVFAGVTFNRERVPRTLQEGQSATPAQLEADLHTRWVRKFTFGINFPISQIKDAIKK